MINEQEIQSIINELRICAEITSIDGANVEISVDSDWKAHIVLQNLMAEHGFTLVDKQEEPSDEDWCKAIHTYKYNTKLRVENAMIALAEANNMMCKAIEDYLIYELAEGDDTKHVKVTFSTANKVDCATSSPILGVEFRPSEGVRFQDEDGNDDIDDGDLTANELYDICNVLYVGGNAYEFEVTEV